MSQRLGDVAKVLRSKNAGAFEVTFDIFFHDRASYQAFKRSGIFTPELLATLYKIAPADVRSIHWYDEVNAVKATIPRRLSCGEPGDTDVYACQQYIPLWSVEVPDEVARAG
jgi:hypothetical protein